MARSLLIPALAVVALGLASLHDARVSDAAFPGENGRIAFVSNRDGNLEVYSMNPDGSDQRNLTNHPAQDCCPAWSADGTRIAFASNRADPNPATCTTFCNYEIYTMYSDGTGVTRLTNNGAVDQMPSWSPDGSQIAFHGNRDGDFEIFAMNANGTGLTQVTENDDTADYLPAWSPGGSHLAFVRNLLFDTVPQVHLVSVVDGSETTLAGTCSNTAPNWSPEGWRLTFGRTCNGGSSEVFSMSAAGANQTQLTNAAGSDQQPAWSPDGSRIAFASGRDDVNPAGCGSNCNLEIYAMNADGTGQTRLTNSAGADVDPDWQAGSGDSGSGSVGGIAELPEVAARGLASDEAGPGWGLAAAASGALLSSAAAGRLAWRLRRRTKLT